MVTAAEDLLLGTGWLPDPLRTLPLPEEDAPEIELIDNDDIADGAPSDDDPDTGEAQSAEDGGEQAIGESDVPGEDDPVAGDAFARTAAE
jgi:ParB family chromosome partitioning protein